LGREYNLIIFSVSFILIDSYFSSFWTYAIFQTHLIVCFCKSEPTNLGKSQEQVTREFLEIDEIKLLEELKNLSPSLELKRDLIPFACFTGLLKAEAILMNYSTMDDFRDFEWKIPYNQNSMMD
jgi:hypothetical protein